LDSYSLTSEILSLISLKPSLINYQWSTIHTWYSFHRLLIKDWCAYS